MPSKRWQIARREIEKLRSHFLPPVFDPLGQYAYSDGVRSNTRAFVVFAHAEVETFLENSAKSIAKAAEELWLSSKRFSVPLGYLTACIGEKVKTPSSPVGPTTRDVPSEFEDAAVKVFQAFYKRVSDNHGVKEANLLALFSPIGLRLSALSPTLIPNLNSFGTSRGEQAHHSTQAVVNVLVPETEYARVVRLLDDLLTLDTWAVEQRRRIR